MKRRLLSLTLAICIPMALLAVDQSWKAQVSEKDRSRVNPYAGEPDAIEAGARLFADHCSRCHGEEAMGEGKHPSLRTPDVQDASDGEIFWILKNGYLRRGMPSWSALPEPSRWQLVAYVKSLGITSGQSNPAK
jgi:mono/diheme cytochrome c family protein